MENEDTGITEAQRAEALRKIKEATVGKGPMIVVETGVKGAEFAGFRVPSSAEWTRYNIARAGTPAEKATAGRPLVFACCAYPTEPGVFESWIDAHPGLVETYIGELIEHAGANQAKKVHKL